MSTPYDGGAADEQDRGAQPERTRLAWRRTTLAFAVAAALGIRSVLDGAGGPPAYAVAALAALVWLAFLAVAHRRIRTLADSPSGPGAGRAIAWAAVCTLTLTVFGTLLLF
ncbi:DUF202 domain-containing protein [Streptomyces armeniacus]|uniref:DUF202 domain-containing protein n=1 Tax=Streptomyces armeniacus TaxID=83291 RepID=A0A345XQX4_9ACTN|nr:DUF202 domain-containing protein [Streptomyces armeniacus]AXK34040.1 DUF202 domain-containing protein [Streptomyces armeniacus]